MTTFQAQNAHCDDSAGRKFIALGAVILGALEARLTSVGHDARTFGGPLVVGVEDCRARYRGGNGLQGGFQQAPAPCLLLLGLQGRIPGGIRNSPGRNYPGGPHRLCYGHEVAEEGSRYPCSFKLLRKR